MQGAFLPSMGGAIAALAVLFALSYVQFRHIALALLVIFAPLPGYVLAVMLHAAEPVLCYLCGFFVAGVLAMQIEAQVCDGVTSVRAAKETLQRYLLPLLWPPVLAIGVTLVLFAAGFEHAMLMQAVAIAACCALAFVGIFSIARVLPNGDEFVVRANRAREARDRWLNRIAFVVQPRWGWSVSGIALIFAVMGFFGGRNTGTQWPSTAGFVLPVYGALLAIIAFAATRDIRRTIAFCLAALMLGALAYWLCGLLAVTASDLLLSGAVAFMPPLLSITQSTIFARAGDSAAVATLRTAETLAVTTIFFCAGAALMCIALGSAAGAILIPCGGVTAFILMPGLTTMIFDLAPPRVSLEAYRVR